MDTIMEYTHLKSGKTYEVLSFECINATNAQDGQKMVIYTGDRRDGNGKGVFAREYNEFAEKFVPKRG